MITDPEIISPEELRIRELRKELEDLQRSKRDKNKKAPTEKSGRGKGRPPIDAADLTAARALAKEYPINDVALVTGISRSSLYAKKISRRRVGPMLALAAAGKR